MPQASSAAWVQEQSQLADSARAEQVGQGQQGQQTARERPKPEEMKRMLVEMETQLNAASDFRERVEEWALLARGYRASEDYAGSARVYAKLMEIEPMNTDWLVERADVLAMGAGRNLRGEPSRLLNLALERTPTHPKAMALAGAAAMAENNYNRARELLSRWRAQLSPELQNSEQVQQLFTQLDLAEQKAKSK
jgi:cytochrome c-type biogenesis protein CcmH